MSDEPVGDSFKEFKNSFYYGSRSDLNFKFLKDLPDEDAAQFFEDLLWKLGDSLDDGDFDRVVKHIYESQAKGYAGPGRFVYENAPFTPLSKPVSQLRLALLTSSGHFAAGDDPKPFGIENMTQKEAETRITDFLRDDPKLSQIPVDTSNEMLQVRHPGYDVRGPQADPNVNLPIARLHEMQAEGRIGELFPIAYSFIGATSQIRLQKQTGPEWVHMFQENHIDAVLLVPVWPVCHVSVGHIARMMEEGGIATVVIGSGIFRDRMAAMKLPRTVITHHPMGRPLGAPGDRETQRKVIFSAFKLLETAREGGMMVDLATRYLPKE